jgi:hypothetical protein
MKLSSVIIGKKQGNYSGTTSQADQCGLDGLCNSEGKKKKSWLQLKGCTVRLGLQHLITLWHLGLDGEERSIALRTRFFALSRKRHYRKMDGCFS